MMRFRFKFSLRYRVAFAFLMLGWLISMTMGTVLYHLTINLEEQIIEETLASELDDYIKRYSIDADTHAPSSIHLRAYVINGEMLATLPPQLHDLPLGLTHITLKGQGYYVETKEHQHKRFFVLYADKLIQQRESQYVWFLAAGMMLMTLLSSILGLWLARQVIAPVTDLAQRVSAMRPDFISPLTDSLTKTTKKCCHDEVRQLSLAINDYHQRLLAFNERERAFTGDVSHELRTPLAVIEGATEVMLSQPNIEKKSQQRIERIARASRQMKHLTTALLTLAREEAGHSHQVPCPVRDILINVIDEHRYLLKHKRVNVELDTILTSKPSHSLVIQCDPVLLYVVLANIIRNAFSYTQQGTVHISIEGRRILVQDTGIGMTEEQLQHIFDHHYSTHSSQQGQGIGLSLAWRICKRYDWEISAHSEEGQGTSIGLLLSRK